MYVEKDKAGEKERRGEVEGRGGAGGRGRGARSNVQQQVQTNLTRKPAHIVWERNRWSVV